MTAGTEGSTGRGGPRPGPGRPAATVAVVARETGQSDWFARVVGGSSSLRLPPGMALTTATIGAPAGTTRWAEGCAAVAAVAGAVVVLLPGPRGLRSEDVDLATELDELTGGHLACLVLAEGAGTEGATAGEHDDEAAEVAEALGALLARPVALVPADVPSGPWGSDPAWMPVEAVLTRLAGVAAAHTAPADPRDALGVAERVAEARRLLAAAAGRPGAVARAQDVWVEVLRLSRAGSGPAVDAAVWLLGDRDALQRLRLDRGTVLAAVPTEAARHAVGSLGLDTAGLLALRSECAPGPARVAVEEYLVSLAERHTDAELAAAATGSANRDVAARAERVVGRSALARLESAGTGEGDVASLLTRIGEADADLAAWLARTEGADLPRLAPVRAELGRRRPEARRAAILTVGRKALRGLQVLYLQPVVDRTAWRSRAAAAVGEAETWLASVPPSAAWAQPLRGEIERADRFTRVDGQAWADADAARVVEARRRTARAGDRWEVAGIIGALVGVVALFLLTANPFAAAIGGMVAVVVLFAARSGHHRASAEEAWTAYYKAAEPPEPVVDHGQAAVAAPGPGSGPEAEAGPDDGAETAS